MLQRTIKNSVHCKGVGLHSGKQAEMYLHPAGEDTGILFSIRNGEGNCFLTPKPELVVDTGLATTLGNGKEQVATVEHLLAAIRGMGIDNIRIEVLGNEVPIMDGSAASFVYLLNQAGVAQSSKPRRFYALKKPITFELDGKYVKAEPHDGFEVDYTIDFPHPRIGRQRMLFDGSVESFASDVARARTFGFLKQVEYLHANGLALGGSLDNAVVLDDYDVLNSDGLRFADEFVRHKVLDFVGDMAVLDLPLRGRFEVFASGHALNNAFLRFLEENADDYLEEVVPGGFRPSPLEEPELAPVEEPVSAMA